jgi:hypothetical protein
MKVTPKEKSSSLWNMTRKPNKALYPTAIPLRFIAAGEPSRYAASPNTLQPRQSARAWPKAGEREENGRGGLPRARCIL